MEFSNSLPIYAQIVEDFKRQIASGKLGPGDKVGAVRELAIAMGVNPNTMQKALATLESEELLYTERTSGRYVTRDTAAIDKMRREMLKTEAGQFVKNVLAMGYGIEDAVKALREI